jgi:hypothetical protein
MRPEAAGHDVDRRADADAAALVLAVVVDAA